MIRSFIAVDIPCPREVERLVDGLRGSGARLSIPRLDVMHVTLKFLGDIDEGLVGSILEMMGTVTAEAPPFKARLKGTGAFPNLRNPRVLWIGLEEGGRLVALAKRVDRAVSSLGFDIERREFRPHVTIARVKGATNLDRARSLIEELGDADFAEFEVRDLRLKRSTLTPKGAVYADLGIAPLSGRDAYDG